jgi:tetratricopeptide (TPR) repeat protein
MRKTGWWVGLCLMAVSASTFAQASISIVDQLQTQRQAFAQDNNVDLQQLSHDIQVAVHDANALDQAGKDTDALARLQTLNKYAPLTQFPSVDVQILCANIYSKLSQASDAAACHDRAVAMADILHRQSGSGSTPDDPVHVITIEEIGEWTRSQSATISNVRGYPHNGMTLQAITYASPATGGNATIAYFQFAPRLNTSISNTVHDVFAPLPVSAKDGAYQTALTQAHDARAKFMNDLSFNYLELIQLCNTTQRDAMQLAQQGDYKGALAKLHEVDRIRPIQDIPIFAVISNYSFLLGKSGDVDGQANARLFLFGITQDIAHSGDGVSKESAVHVIATSEEYSWLAAKKLRMTKQALIQDGDRRYDQIDAVDANGATHSYYFEVSQVFARESILPK